jgi:aspartate aminotransferase
MTANSNVSASLPDHVKALKEAISPILEFETGPLSARRKASRYPCDFVFGRPHEATLPGFVNAIQLASAPQGPGWFAYKYSEEAPRQAVVASLQRQLGLAFDPDDILLTNGAWSALAIIFQTLLGTGDEVVYIRPWWFYYKAMILAAGGVGIAVPCNSTNFDLDVDAIAAAISARTRAVLVNSPNNPTGRVYPKATLQKLGDALEMASARYGRRIYLISDEAYHRVVFPETTFVSPAAYYSHSCLVYSYGKTLLVPGQRLGYIALSPGMSNAPEMRSALFITQTARGQGWPDAIMQYALPEIEELCIDLDRLRRRRDILVDALGAQGYSVHVPEGAFYLLPRSPIPDDVAFAKVLADRDVFVLPGRTMQIQGYFRVSLTADDEMISRSLNRFDAARRAAI